jgi:ABC-type transport system substrate-binding protein
MTMLSRRELLTIGAGSVAAAALPRRAAAQTPKRGGTLTLRTWDPPHFDHILAHAYKTHVVISFTHSRLLRHKAGPGVRPGAFPIEGDLAESWQQTSDTTYVFKLRRGVRFHAKPPVNGRELTAEDVRYTFERLLSEKGSTNASMFRSLEDRGRRPLHGALHAQGAVRVVSRHGCQPDGGRHHRARVRGKIR